MFNYSTLKKQYEANQTPESLAMVRQILDLHGYRMPIPKYPYNPKSKLTWKYLDVVVKYDQKTSEIIECSAILNPLFAYK